MMPGSAEHCKADNAAVMRADFFVGVLFFLAGLGFFTLPV